jgi:co-chaperonin GroES (HSP10)
MKSPTKIIITVDKKFNDEMDFNGGKIYLDPTYRPEHNAIEYGHVVSIPARTIPQEGYAYNVEVGDKLYVNYGILMDEELLLEHEGVEYFLVDYFMALATVRDGQIYPVGEHILIQPLEEEVKSTLIIPEMLRKKVSNDGIVFASNDPSIPVGAKVAFEENGKFENVIEGNKLFVMYNSNIMYVYE